jgi:peptidoglycan/LPS O-acetylase OafA/YrhL
LSYQFYIIAGGVAALHLDQFASWVANHRPLVIGSVGVSLSLGLVNYAADLSFLHMNVLQASQVFQPLIAVEAVVFAVGLFCLGQWVDERNSQRSLRVASAGSDASFGVYLAHPLILSTLLLPLLRSAGILRAVKAAGTPVTLLFDLGVVIPVVYVICALGVTLARRTPLSLALTGRRARPRTEPAAALPRWIPTPRTEPSPVTNSIAS